MRFCLALAILAACGGPAVPPEAPEASLPDVEMPSPAQIDMPKLRIRLDDECSRLVNVINYEQGPLKDASGSDPDALHELASVLRHVAERVGQVTLDDGQLSDFRDQYAIMAEDLAAASDATAKALAANDPTLAAESARKMGSFGARESNMVNAINAHCRQELSEAQLAEKIKACEGGDADACDAAATSIGTKDPGRSAGLYLKACDANATYACGTLGKRYFEEDNAAKGVPLLQRACDDRWAAACATLGEALKRGEGVGNDAARARALWERGCASGHDDSCKWLAREPADDARDAALEKGCDDYGAHHACKPIGREKY